MFELIGRWMAWI